MSTQIRNINDPCSIYKSDYYKGYLEDRRPAGNADPYKVVNRIITTIEHQ